MQATDYLGADYPVSDMTPPQKRRELVVVEYNAAAVDAGAYYNFSRGYDCGWLDGYFYGFGSLLVALLVGGFVWWVVEVLL